jgi:hypothetical protein
MANPNFIKVDLGFLLFLKKNVTGVYKDAVLRSIALAHFRQCSQYLREDVTVVGDHYRVSLTIYFIVSCCISGIILIMREDDLFIIND